MENRIGFYTAMGTPMDEQGKIIEESLIKQIEMQINAGASGLLLLGSMGIQPTVSPEECIHAARVASACVNKRVPLFVGVMDNSVCNVMSRINAMKGLSIDGVVLTTPFYFKNNDATLLNYFTQVADMSPFPVYLYDLPVSVKQKITVPMAETLSKHPNIHGIKTADILMILKLKLEGIENDSFRALYSGLDTVDVGCANGIRHYLDGMFACTPKNAQAMEKCFAAGDIVGAQKHLKAILRMRDEMLSVDLMPAFTHAMNLLGMEGRFHPDLHLPFTDFGKAHIENVMREIGEIA